MKKKSKNTQLDLLLEFFRKHPNQNIPLTKIVDWAVKEWNQRTGNIFRDLDRGIRTLHEKGLLIKIKKGVYSYDPQKVKYKKVEDFNQDQKKIILKQDEHKCVMCGKGKAEGVELHIDHIKPKDHGGKAEIKNGQVLCSQHNFLKKNLKQTEIGKKMFTRLYQLAKTENNKTLKDFCYDILKTYEYYDIDGHIDWRE